MLKKRKVTITDHKMPNGTYCISMYNVAFYPNIINKIIQFIKEYTVGMELYFGLYRTDGIYLSNDEMLRYSLEIPEFFRNHGEYHLMNKLGLLACRANSHDLYEILDKIFFYYLDTIIFVPKIDWNTFINSYKNYMSGVTKEYIVNGYTDILFAYTDSGDFSVLFDPQKYDPKLMYQKMNDIVE